MSVPVLLLVSGATGDLIGQVEGAEKLSDIDLKQTGEAGLSGAMTNAAGGAMAAGVKNAQAVATALVTTGTLEGGAKAFGAESNGTNCSNGENTGSCN